jgi:ribokinase
LLRVSRRGDEQARSALARQRECGFQVRIDGTPEFGGTLLARDFCRLGGGKAANVAFLARRLDVGAQLLARVGDDDLKEQALQPLREIGVDLSRTSAVPGHSTGVALIAVRPDGQKAIILAGNANEAWTRDGAGEVVAAIERAPEGSVLVVD